MNPETTQSHTGRPHRRRRRRPSGEPRRDVRLSIPVEQIAPEAAAEPPLVPFEALTLHPALLESVRERGFATTTPIQASVIPIALEGHDLIGCAETGTGKTAAFLLPVLHRLLEADGAGGSPGRTRVLILAPTRELAVQIEDDVAGFTYHTPLSSVAVYGGVGMDVQERALRAGVDIVVATPGRLMDHMRTGTGSFDGLQVLVLDEADRMMDMGFWPDVRRIVSALPASNGAGKARQTLLFSATMPEPVLKLAREIMQDARMVQVGPRGAPARTITHAVQTVETREKPAWLANFLRGAEGQVLVFCRTRHGAERLARRLAGMGLQAAALHADRSQEQRTSAIEGFRSGRVRVLVATDIAARGLDVDGITHVVNFEVPTSRDAYVHRVGRTGRAEATGVALTLAAPEELRALQALERIFGLQLQ